MVLHVVLFPWASSLIFGFSFSLKDLANHNSDKRCLLTSPVTAAVAISYKVEKNNVDYMTLEIFLGHVSAKEALSFSPKGKPY